MSAASINSGLKSLAEIDETTAATLRFGNERVATFITSFNAADVAAYRIVGTNGHLHVDPAYEYAEGLEYTVEINGKKKTKRAGKRDQFAPELLYFSDCICMNRRARNVQFGSGPSERPSGRRPANEFLAQECESPS